MRPATTCPENICVADTREKHRGTSNACSDHARKVAIRLGRGDFRSVPAMVDSAPALLLSALIQANDAVCVAGDINFKMSRFTRHRMSRDIGGKARWNKPLPPSGAT
jgi:hypothetical protein